MLAACSGKTSLFQVLKVLAHTQKGAGVGASLVRDAADSRVVKSVQDGTGSIINNEDQVGGWPNYKTYKVLKDADMDGMPDLLEKQNGFNPADPADRNGDLNKDGYTNLEEYLNSLISVKH